MFNKYFGNYILTKNIITNDQLKNVLSKQKSAKVKLGVLAIESGYMNAFQVNRVHKLQVLQDKRFGEIAINEGFLTEEKLAGLLSSQKNSHIMIGQILVDEEILTYDEYEKLLIEYKKDSGFTDKEIEILKSNNTDEIVNMFIKMQKTNEVVLFQEYVELFLRNIIRFVDSDLMIDKPYCLVSYEYKNLASQEIVGENKIITGISADDEVLVKFAGIYAEEEITEMDEMARDAIGEFMNCQNGLFVSNLYHKGINHDLNPQKFDFNSRLNQNNQLFVLPCSLSIGNIDIIFNI
ncbi:MAG: hypothetical protein MJA31_15645 [Clostridia bacterium]|nr:hypothetical protein [Clostridia bacterium]